MQLGPVFIGLIQPSEVKCRCSLYDTEVQNDMHNGFDYIWCILFCAAVSYNKCGLGIHMRVTSAAYMVSLHTIVVSKDCYAHCDTFYANKIFTEHIQCLTYCADVVI